MQGDDEKAKEVIARIYVTKGDQTKINNILHVEKSIVRGTSGEEEQSER